MGWQGVAPEVTVALEVTLPALVALEVVVALEVALPALVAPAGVAGQEFLPQELREPRWSCGVEEQQGQGSGLALSPPRAQTLSRVRTGWHRVAPDSAALQTLPLPISSHSVSHFPSFPTISPSFPIISSQIPHNFPQTPHNSPQIPHNFP